MQMQPMVPMPMQPMQHMSEAPGAADDAPLVQAPDTEIRRQGTHHIQENQAPMPDGDNAVPDAPAE